MQWRFDTLLSANLVSGTATIMKICETYTPLNIYILSPLYKYFLLQMMIEMTLICRATEDIISFEKQFLLGKQYLFRIMFMYDLVI